ncbi:MAG: hypothetical protein QW128_00240 [Thermoprotei archaeon]
MSEFLITFSLSKNTLIFNFLTFSADFNVLTDAMMSVELIPALIRPFIIACPSLPAPKTPILSVDWNQTTTPTI